MTRWLSFLLNSRKQAAQSRTGRWLRGAAGVAVTIIALMSVGGCASTSSVESRKQERPAAYAALSDEEKQLVDQGQIKAGMSQDAVYLAWGRPDDVVENETREGHATVWLYTGTVMQETRYWTYREISRGGGRPFLARVVDSDYNPQDYVRAEIVFVKGTVNSWRTLPRPLN